MELMIDHYPIADYPMEDEGRMAGYDTIVFPSPLANDDFDTPLSSPLDPSKSRSQSVIVNNAAKAQMHFRKRNSWNPNVRSGIIIQHASDIPKDAIQPRIVEVTGMEDDEEGGQDIANPDYPRSETETSDRVDGYPRVPGDAGPPLPDRDYHSNSDSRPDIHRVNLNGGDTGDSPGMTIIPPAAPPPPPLPEAQQPADISARSSRENTSQPSQGNIELEVPHDQELHIVLRRALARNHNTTQQTLNEADQTQGEGAERASRESYTQTRQEPQQSTQVQTTLKRHSLPDQSDGHRSETRNDTSQTRPTGDNKSKTRSKSSSGKSRSLPDENPYGPRFRLDPFTQRDNTQSSQWPNSGVETDGPPRRSSRIIERIIITREIDPTTGQPLEPQPQSAQSLHDIVYNASVRESNRRPRGWGPFSDSYGNWSPRDGNEHIELDGIVAGMETGTDSADQYSYMPRERSEWMGTRNQGYDVSPPEERRRTTSRAPWVEGQGIPPPPPYTPQDMPPPQLRSSMAGQRSEGHGWGRLGRPRNWAGPDSDVSSTVAAGWTQRTRVVFAVMLLLCIILLLTLVIVVSVYFTVGPGRGCLDDDITCEDPSIGYIVAFGVIGFLAFLFILIGLILCCFACRTSRENRMQNYPVTSRR